MMNKFKRAISIISTISLISSCYSFKINYIDLDKRESIILKEGQKGVKITGNQIYKKNTLERRVERDYGKLVIKWAGVVDNGEEDPRHLNFISRESKGELHLLVYDDNYRCPEDRKKYKNYLNHVVLRGPSGNEWLDGDEKSFKDLEIFNWRGEKDSVLVFVYESDPWKWGQTCRRKHNTLFCERIVKRKFDQLELYRSNHKCGEDVIKKFEDNPPSWLKNVWRNSVNRHTHKMYMGLKTIH